MHHISLRRVRDVPYADYSPHKDSENPWLLYSLPSTWIPVCKDNNPPEIPNRRSIVPLRVVREVFYRSSATEEIVNPDSSHTANILIRSMFIHRLFYIDIFLSFSPLSNFFLNILINHYISFTWYFLGSDCECFTKLHKATELRSSVHSVCNGSCFTLLQKGWIDFPLKHWNIFM